VASAAGRWFDDQGSSAAQLQNRYGTPQAAFRRSGADPALASTEYILRRIRAAIVRPPGPVPAEIIAVPWSMQIQVPGSGYRMILVSVPDAAGWVERFRPDCWAWYLAASGPVWQYEEYQHLGAEEADSEPARTGPRPRTARQAQLELDVRLGEKSVRELCTEYSVNQDYVYALRSRLVAGINNRTPEYRERLKQLTPTIIAEIRSGLYTRQQVADRNGLLLNTVQHIMLRHKITNTMPRGRRPNAK